MADEKKDQKQPKAGEEAPKRRRSTGTRESEAEKPAGAKRATRASAASKPASGTKRRAPARSKQTAAKPKAEAPKEGAPAAEAEEAKPAPARPEPRTAREPRDRAPTPSRPIVTARAKYVRSSARKARLVLEHVRGKTIQDARAVLRHSPRGVARDLERLLDSAVANAENNHDLVGDDLLVKEAYADEGPTLKRFRARAQGRAYRIRKRTSHLTMTLTPKE
jgi:large subunit ribosomal protein L22